MDKIYKISSPNGKCYIGRTNDLERRLVEHKHCATKKKLPNSLYRAIRKYGWDNMRKEVICEIDSSQSQKIEEELIQAHNSVKKGYNDTYIGSGGDQWYGRRDTTEYMEFIQKMKKINQTNRMHGKKHSKEAIQKQKEKAKGRFSLDWYIDRNGLEEGTKLYEERRTWLKNRNLNKDKNGRFIKKSDNSA
jgi:group I intron endonuclease